jgi:hypothetical protein
MGTIGTQTVDTTERLSVLRSLMADRNIDAYIVPTEDQRRCSTCPFRETSSHTVWNFQISASILQSAISVGHSSLGSMALLVCSLNVLRISRF